MASSLLRYSVLSIMHVRRTLRQKMASFLYECILGEVHRPFRIDLGVEILNPHQVRIKKNVLIRDGTIINGRSADKEFGIDLGEGTYIKGHSYIDAYGGYIEIRGNTNISQYCLLAGQGGVSIGEYVMFGSHCCVLSSNHIFHDLELPYMLQGDTASRTIIEDNVWVGAGSIILAGVTIGRNSVIGAGSIVAKDVPANTLFVNKITPHYVRELNRT